MVWGTGLVVFSDMDVGQRALADMDVSDTDVGQDALSNEMLVGWRNISRGVVSQYTDDPVQN